MPAPDPTPVAEVIDEQAARRSIRVTEIAISAFLLVCLLAGLAAALIFQQADHRPGGENDGIPAWAIVLLVAAVGIPLAASAWWMHRQYRRPAYRRVMQYGWKRRRRVTKALLRGRPMSAEDMPVAAAMVELQRSQGRWLVILLCVLPLNSLYQGVIQHGPLRWFQFGVAAFMVVLLPFVLHQRRRIIRNYERLLKDGKQ